MIRVPVAIEFINVLITAWNWMEFLAGNGRRPELNGKLTLPISGNLPSFRSERNDPFVEFELDPR